jgi:single-stranded-DNA-specific exonuclease
MFKRKETWDTSLSLIPEASEIPFMVDAAKRIHDHLKAGELLLICGDYDTDGVCATTIIYSVLSQCSYESQVSWTVPNRFTDGYGVSINIVDYAVKIGATMIVTVDNGIGAKAAVDYANEKGISVIVTDHHTPGDAVPNADVIVNLKLNAGDFPYIEISGATIAWFLGCQLVIEMDLFIDMREYIDLVAITVISDVMPLENMNLTFFEYGLKSIKNRDRKVFEFIFDNHTNKYLSETDIGFKLVPMINASGRIDDAKHAVELFLSNDLVFIKEKVKYMIDVNNRRKNLTQEYLALIMPEVEKQLKNQAIIIRNKYLHEGIVGILAGKIAEQFHKPAYVFGFNEVKDIWKGSGRTSGSAHLYDLTNTAGKHALGFGGHAGAVGVALKEESFKQWEKTIVKNANKIDPKRFFDHDYDPIVMPLSSIDINLLNAINEGRPYGYGFREPVFIAKGRVTILDSFKKGIHWKCDVSDSNGVCFTAWFFHDKRIGNLSEEEVEFHYVPVLKSTPSGDVIELHATIPYC